MSRTVLITATDASLRTPSAAGMNARDYLIERITDSGGAGVRLVEHPDDADLILFAESHLNQPRGVPPVGVRLARHPVVRAHRRRCIVHDGSDLPRPTLPGLYPSVPARWANTLGALGAPYLVRVNPYIEEGEDTTPDRLAGFVGSCRAKPVRKHLLTAARRGGWREIEVHDTGDRFVGTLRNGEREQHLRLKRFFAEHMRRAKFALCPAGAGASSYRIFEAMQCGRVPVIIADSWTPPQGPQWERFSVRVPESRLDALPEILRDHEHRWEQMGRLARQEWTRRYSPEAIGTEIIRLAQLAQEVNMRRARRQCLFAAGYRAGPARIQSAYRLIRKRFLDKDH